MAESELLSIEKLSLSYPGKQVLENLGLSLGTGQIIGLMGASGSGKTSLLKLISGLLPSEYYRGTIHWQAGHRPFRTGMVFQEDRLLPWRTVGQNLRLACLALRPGDRHQAAAESLDILSWLGLSGIDRQYPHELSGGMRQRVALARALLFGRDLQLWDEPFQSLDQVRRLQVAGLVRNRFRSLRTSALVTGHDPGDLLILCDQIFILLPDPDGTRMEYFATGLEEGERSPENPAYAHRRQVLEAQLHQFGVMNPV